MSCKILFYLSSTNLAAENSNIKIDGISIVIDCGFIKVHLNFNPLKVRFYDTSKSISRLIKSPISQATAIQRARIAGRHAPGKCFRMYTESAYNSLDPFPTPEILRSNMALTILHLKSLGIENILNFDFLTSPPIEALSEALEYLYSVNAINDNCRLKIPFGKLMSEFPLDPQLSAIILNSPKYQCTDEALTIAAMLSVKDVFLSPTKKESINAHRKFHVSEGIYSTPVVIVNH